MKKNIALLTLVATGYLLLAGTINAQYGSSSSSSSPSTNTTSTPTCENEKPSTPILYEPNNSLFGGQKKLGEVTLHWAVADRATSYNVLYGLSPRNYIYSGLKIGNNSTTTYSVAGLNPGTTYYFTVQANNDCKPGGLSNEWGSSAGNFFVASAPMDVLGARTRRLGLNTNVMAAEKNMVTPSTVQPTKEIPSPIVTEVEEVQEETSFFGGIVKFIKSILGIE